MHIREEQIEQLRQNIRANQASFTVVYGRRRIGKTQMIDSFVHETGLPTFYNQLRNGHDVVREVVYTLLVVRRLFEKMIQQVKL